MLQVVRNRSCQQNIYDIDLLLGAVDINEEYRLHILTSLLENSTGRLEARFGNPGTLERTDIGDGSPLEYALLNSEISGILLM